MSSCVGPEEPTETPGWPAAFPLGHTSYQGRKLGSPSPRAQLLGPQQGGSNCPDVLGGSGCVRTSASTLGVLSPSGGGNRWGKGDSTRPPV